jgi:hypothetical protein
MGPLAYPPIQWDLLLTHLSNGTLAYPPLQWDLLLTHPSNGTSCLPTPPMGPLAFSPLELNSWKYAGVGGRKSTRSRAAEPQPSRLRRKTAALGQPPTEVPRSPRPVVPPGACRGSQSRPVCAQGRCFPTSRWILGRAASSLRIWVPWASAVASRYGLQGSYSVNKMALKGPYSITKMAPKAHTQYIQWPPRAILRNTMASTPILNKYNGPQGPYSINTMAPKAHTQ